MNQKRKYKTYSKVFKEEAVSLVTDQGYSVAEAAVAVAWAKKNTPLATE